MINEYIMAEGVKIYYDDKLWDRPALKGLILERCKEGDNRMDRLLQIELYFREDIEKGTIKIVK